MSEVKRFKPVINDKPYKPYAHCEESEDGIYVRLSNYAELKAQRDALAAENAALKDFLIDEFRNNGPYHPQDPVLESLKTPATDAYLNSVRAEAIESFAHHQRVIADATPAAAFKRHRRLAAGLAEDYAAQLRAGKDGE